MATIFDRTMNFLGRAFLEAASTDFIRDYKHASELFVGNDFSLVPKSGYLFHVFFDINPYVAYPQLLDPSRLTELGMMVKEVELPKFSIETKTYNSYNRPNVVQSKIKYDNVAITFRDDSMNLVRNFWFDYYSYYYQDTLNTLETHRYNNKYAPETFGSYGYTLRNKNSLAPDKRYLQAIRIYSLTHNQFTEYILINPTIVSYRHSKHDYEEQTSAGMTNEMSVAYEGVLYNDGYIEDGGVKGFATLHYDRTRSPLGRIGSRRSIFGRGGLINTASSIISDITNGNYLSAIFKAATARQTFKGVNLKKAAVSELKTVVTQTATAAVTGLITQQMRSTTPGGYSVVSSYNQPGATTKPGLLELGSTLGLVGVAAFLNSKPSTNKYTQTPITQSTRNLVNSTYNPSFPTVPGAVTAQAPSTILKANDAQLLASASQQQTIDLAQRRIQVNNALDSLEKQMLDLGTATSNSKKQVDNLTVVIANLNNKLALAKSVNSPQDIISGIVQQIESAALQKQDYEATYNRQRVEITALQQQINRTIIERNAING